MPVLDTQGILLPLMTQPEQTNVIYPYLREIFLNELPLITSLPRVPAEAESYTITLYDVRPRKYTLAAAVTSASVTSATISTITLADATPLNNGDVLEIIKTDGTAIERVEVQGDPVAPGTVNVRRCAEGTTAVANDVSANTVVRLIGNSRTGGEINQNGHRAVRSGIPQNVQTFQFPIQVAGKTMAIQNVRLPRGIPNIFSLEEKVAMTEMMRDEEYSSYYGLGDKPGSNNNLRAKQSGLRKLIGYYGSPDSGVTPGPNVVVNAGASFTKLNMIQKLQLAVNAGGRPNVILCSTDFFGAISTWTLGSQFITAGTTAIGEAITAFQTAFLGRPVTFMPSSQLELGTFCALTWEDVRIRTLREEQFSKRGIMGDAVQADMLCDVCIELGHPGWHVWVSGITSFA